MERVLASENFKSLLYTQKYILYKISLVSHILIL